ncbi:MAG: Holliday junction resolvase RuvX [Leptothrix sp. (in: Bacteria)]|nr:Holliday junction resolvase RuvX [Leptothrix sp. (in: b-proteobacteria)]
MTWSPQARWRSRPPGGAVRQRPGRAGSAAGSLVVAARSFLAFDFGTRRTGVATGNSLLGRAQALKTLATEGDARFAAIAALIAEWQPDALVVGVPFHPDGAEHDNTRRARRFARQLQGRFGLPVHEVDERYTTTEALAAGAADADAAAAAIILDQFLNQLPRSADATA